MIASRSSSATPSTTSGWPGPIGSRGGPCAELLQDPRSLPDGRVGERVRDRVWFPRVEEGVAAVHRLIAREVVEGRALGVGQVRVLRRTGRSGLRGQPDTAELQVQPGDGLVVEGRHGGPHERAGIGPEYAVPLDPELAHDGRERGAHPDSVPAAPQ